MVETEFDAVSQFNVMMSSGGLVSVVGLADAHTHSHLCVGGGASAIAGAFAAGVTIVVVCATSPEDWSAVESACAGGTGLGLGLALPSLGVHPWHVGAAGDVSVWAPQLLARLRALRGGGGVAVRGVGVGEAGLDRSEKALLLSPWHAQVEALNAQIAVAAELHAPLSLHCVRAQTHLVKLLRAAAPALPSALLLHSWAGTPRDAAALRALGIPCVFSFSGGLVAASKASMAGAEAAAQGLPPPPRTPGAAGKDALASLLTLPASVIAFETDSPDQGWEGEGSHPHPQSQTQTLPPDPNASTAAGGTCCLPPTGSGRERLRNNLPAMLFHVIRAAARLRLGPAASDAAVAAAAAELGQSSASAVARIFLSNSRF